MAYPPMPYPPLQAIQEQQTSRPTPAATGIEGEGEASGSPKDARQAKRRPLFSSPFKTPSTVATSQVPATPRRTKVQDLASGSDASPGSTDASPTTPSALPARRLARTTVPFKTPTKPTHTTSERSTATEIAQLERRIAQLRQARRYQLATERGDRDGDGELERLCEKWKDAGKLAAEMLFEQLPSPESAFSSNTNDSFASWGFADLSASSKRTSSDPWGSSWCFSSSPPSSDPFGPGSSSSFSKRGPTSEEIVSDFMRKIDEEAQARGVSRHQVLQEFEDREHDEGGMDLAHPDIEFAKLAQLSKKRVAAKRKAGTGSASSTGSKRVKLDDGEDRKLAKTVEDDDSEDELLDALEELIATSSEPKEGAEDEVDEDERADMQEDRHDTVEREDDVDDEVGQPEEKEWNVGSMMQRVGIDPTLFGWDETFEAFA